MSENSPAVTPELVAAVVLTALEQLQQSDRVRLRLPHLGLDVSGYFNYSFNLKISVSRLDRKPFFSVTDDKTNKR